MRIIGLSLFCVVFLTAGCSILPEPEKRPIYYFDIAVPPKKIVLNVPVEFSFVEFAFSEKTQMSFRDVGNSVRLDEYNRWSDLPSNLLRKHFLLAFNNTTTDKSNLLSEAKSLNIYILRFDFDLRRKTANVTALFVIYDADGRKIAWRAMIAAEEKTKKESAAGYAEAMSAAVSDLTTRLVAKLNATPLLISEFESSLKNDKK